MQRRTFLSRTLNRVTAGGVVAGILNPFETGRSIKSFYIGDDTDTTRLVSTELKNGWRRRTGDEYRLEYEWGEDLESSRKRVGVTIGRSEYERAARQSLGYVGAFDAARTSPIAKRVATALSDDVHSSDGNPLTPQRRLAMVISFVRSFEYATDPDSKGSPEYHRSVAETLVEGRGDCKDLTYLLAGILSAPPFGYRTAMVFVPEHMLVGVRIEDLPNGADCDRLADTGYVPIETTSDDPIGELSRDPLIGIHDRGFEYFDHRAVSETAATSVQTPSGTDVISGIA